MSGAASSTPERLIAGARAHGEESDPEHEAGDLADVLRHVWPKLSTLDQRDTYERFASILEWCPERK